MVTKVRKTFFFVVVNFSISLLLTFGVNYQDLFVDENVAEKKIFASINL